MLRALARDAVELPDGHGELTLDGLVAPAVERHQVLHRALAEGVLADDDTPVVVLDRAREDLRRRGAVAIDQHGQRTGVGGRLLRTIEVLDVAGPVAQLHDRAVRDEEAGEGGRLRQIAAAVVPQVEHQSVDVLGFEFLEQPQDIARGAAVVGITAVLRGDVLVEARHRDDADTVSAAVVGHGLELALRLLRLQRHLVADELEDPLLGPGRRAGRQYLQPDRRARLAADELHHVIEAPADDAGHRTIGTLTHAGDAIARLQGAGDGRRPSGDDVHYRDVVVDELERGTDALV